MSEELYQDLIIEHSRTPLNFGKLEGACDRTRMQNPLCGDEIDLYVRFENGKVTDCRFEGFGCSISKAAASILSEEVKGKGIKEIEQLIASYHALLTENQNCNCTNQIESGSAQSCSAQSCSDWENDIGDLVVFSGVQQYPTRIRCATLAVEALAKLISRHKDPQE